MILGSDSLTAMNRMTISNAGSSGSAGVSSLERNLQNRNDEKIKQACSDFEAIFIKQMLDSMRKTVEKTSLLGGGMAEAIFEDMIYDEYAKKNKSYGLTTLKEGHITIDRSDTAEGELDAIFEFTGKSGKHWHRRIWQDDLALLIEASGMVGGRHKKQDLFRYEDGNGNDFDIKSHHVNEYLDACTASVSSFSDRSSFSAMCTSAGRRHRPWHTSDHARIAGGTDRHRERNCISTMPAARKVACRSGNSFPKPVKVNEPYGSVATTGLRSMIRHPKPLRPLHLTALCRPT